MNPSHYRLNPRSLTLHHSGSSSGCSFWFSNQVLVLGPSSVTPRCAPVSVSVVKQRFLLLKLCRPCLSFLHALTRPAFILVFVFHVADFPRVPVRGLGGSLAALHAWRLVRPVGSAAGRDPAVRLVAVPSSAPRSPPPRGPPPARGRPGLVPTRSGSPPSQLCWPPSCLLPSENLVPFLPVWALSSCSCAFLPSSCLCCRIGSSRRSQGDCTFLAGRA